VEFEYTLALCICPANPVSDEEEWFTEYWSLINEIMGERLLDMQAKRLRRASRDISRIIPVNLLIYSTSTGVSPQSVLLSGDVTWVDFAETSGNVTRQFRIISDAEMNTAVLFASEAEANQAMLTLIGGGWIGAVSRRRPVGSY
jgi:hypothetical protein